MKTKSIYLSMLLSCTYFTSMSQQQQYNQLIIGNKTSIPTWVSMWIEGNSNPGILFNRTGQSVDEGLWATMVIADEFRIMTEKDNFSAIKSAFVIKRGVGINISNVTFPEGVVGIGTTNPDPNFKLSVNGAIRSKEVKVEANWSDFVFEKKYKLRTLDEVEQHINEKGHLPEIPSEAEVTKNGINLGEMDAKLLMKIEELTLYIIEMNKRVGQLEQDNTELKRSNQELSKKVQLIENQ